MNADSKKENGEPDNSLVEKWGSATSLISQDVEIESARDTMRELDTQLSAFVSAGTISASHRLSVIAKTMDNYQRQGIDGSTLYPDEGPIAFVSNDKPDIYSDQSWKSLKSMDEDFRSLVKAGKMTELDRIKNLTHFTKRYEGIRDVGLQFETTLEEGPA